VTLTLTAQNNDRGQNTLAYIGAESIVSCDKRETFNNIGHLSALNLEGDLFQDEVQAIPGK
jgi:hypothetical protein